MHNRSECRLVLALVMTGVFLSTMDSGMINVALPTILRTFSLTLQEAESLISVYLGTITVTLVFWGRLADSLGRGRVYLLGVVIFALGSLFCYFAQSFLLLLASRFLQALGAAMMMATGPALIKTVFPTDHLGRSLGLVGIATACGLLSGPLLSGLILHHASWRLIFLVSLPVCLLVVLLSWAFGLHRLGGIVAKEKSAFDWLGSCCWVALVVVGLTLLHRLDRLLEIANLLVALAWVSLLWCFVRIEGRARHPILPLQLLRQRYYWVAVLTAALSFATMFIVLVVTPFYLTYALQLPVKEVGEVMTAVPAMLILLSPLSGLLYDKIGARFLTTAGLGLCCLALLGMASLNGESKLGEVALFLALLGAGQSVFLTPNSASVLSQVDELWTGITAGILATARNFGMVIGATLAATLLSWWFTFYSGGTEFSAYTVNDHGAFVLAVKTTFLFAACLALLGGVFSARRA
jgi:MFS family permease